MSLTTLHEIKTDNSYRIYYSTSYTCACDRTLFLVTRDPDTGKIECSWKTHGNIKGGYVFWPGDSADRMSRCSILHSPEGETTLEYQQALVSIILKFGHPTTCLEENFLALLDSKIVKLHRKIMGISAMSISTYNFLTEYKDVIQQLDAAKQTNILITSLGLLLSNQPGSSGVTKESFSNAKTLIDQVKGDLNRRQWGVLLQLPVGILRSLVKYDFNSTEQVQEFCRIVDKSEIPLPTIRSGRLTSVARMIMEYRLPHYADTVREGLKALTILMIRSGRGDEFVARQAVSIKDFLRETQPTPQQVARWGYEGCVTRSREWHENWQLNRGGVRTAYPRGLVWDSGIEQQEMEGHSIIPLNTSDELGMEGRIMQHCVGGYHNYCIQGTSVIFSIRSEDGERVGTLELRRRAAGDREWYRNILLSTRNRQVTARVAAIADQFIVYYNENNTRGD